MRCGSAAAGQDQVRFDGVASFGRRPTFDNGAPLLEVFLFDFKGDLYGTALDVAFIAFIREELKFDSIDALVRQMDDDSARARAALAAAPDAFPKLGMVDVSPDDRSHAAHPMTAACRQGFAIQRLAAMESRMFARRTISISGPASA